MRYIRRLVQIFHDLKDYASKMNPLEEEFIEASQLAHEGKLREPQRRKSAFISGAWIIVVILALSAIIYNRHPDQNHRIANTAQATSTLATIQQSTAEFNAIARTTAEANARKQADLARSRELAAFSTQALQRGNIIEAYQLAVRSYRMAATLESERSLYSAIAHNLPEQILEGHVDAVRSAVFSPDGKRIVTASDDGTARVWDVESGAELAILDGHTDVVTSAFFSSDGKRILTASRDGTARVWATGADELLRIAEERLANLGIVVE